MKFKRKVVRRNSSGYRLEDDESVAVIPVVVTNSSGRNSGFPRLEDDQLVAGSSVVINDCTVIHSSCSRLEDDGSVAGTAVVLTDCTVRNCSGSRLADDESVVGSPVVVTYCPVRPTASNSHVGQPFLVNSTSVSDSILEQGDHFRDFMEVDDCLVPDHVWDALGSTPMRMSSGIVINEPATSGDPYGTRTNHLTDESNYIGKGKAKMNDAPPLSSHVFPSIDGDENTAFPSTFHVSTGLSCIPNQYVVGSANTHYRFETNVQDALPSFVSTSFNSSVPQPCSANIEHAPPVPTSDRSFGVRTAVPPGEQPLCGTPPHASAPVTTPSPARRRQRQRPFPRARSRRFPPGSAVPRTNATGAPSTYVSLGSCNKTCCYCGALFWFEERIKNGRVRFPDYHRCCKAGRVVLRHQLEYPLEVQQLFTVSHFMDNIRAYNSMNMSINQDLAISAKSAGKRPVTDLEVVPVSSIKPSDIGKAVRVKVYRKWTLTSARGAKPATLTFILLDQMGRAIQANVDPKERKRFESLLEMGKTYTITGFGLLDTRNWMRALANNFILMFGKFTNVQPLFEVQFPEHYFNFASYEDLPMRADNNEAILTDYIGCVLQVGDLRQPGSGNQRPVVWRDIILRNLEGNTVRFTLWNEKAREFDTDAYDKEPKPTVMAVTSCWVKTYSGLQLSSTAATYYYMNPPIPETEYILSMYNELLAPPVIQNVRLQRYDDIEQEKLRNRTTIDELLREDPRNQTNVRFTVVATVTAVIRGKSWYFRRCKTCRHKIFDSRPHGHCPPPEPQEANDYSYSFRLSLSDSTGTLLLTCFSNEAHSMVLECNKLVSEEGNNDPYVLPPALTALEGTTHLFQLHFASESTKENPIFILDTTMETGPHLLTEPDPIPDPEVLELQQSNEVLCLTGPQHDTDARTNVVTSPETLRVAPTSPKTCQQSSATSTETSAQILQNTPPPTPPSELLKVSAETSAETKSVDKRPAVNPQQTRLSVRRNLLKDDSYNQPGSVSKKTKQE